MARYKCEGDLIFVQYMLYLSRMAFLGTYGCDVLSPRTHGPPIFFSLVSHQASRLICGCR